MYIKALDKFTEGRQINPEREKPWGTAHAVLCCKGKVDLPFAVINADDFYGKDAFKKAFDFLQAECNKKTYGVIAYELPKYFKRTWQRKPWRNFDKRSK